MKRNFKSYFNKDSVIYYLVHLVVFLAGVILVSIFKDKPIIVAIGISLIAAGISGWIIYYYIFSTKELAQNVKLVTDFGIEKIYSKRSISIREEYDERVSNAKKSIDVMGFGLSAFKQDHLKDFKKWKNQVRMRILLIDPYYPSKKNSYALQRDDEENNTLGTIENHVKSFVKETTSIIEDGKFEVKLYRCLPMINIFRIDNEILWGPYLIKDQSRNMPTFLIKNGILFEAISKHFDDIWHDSNLSITPPSDYFD